MPGRFSADGAHKLYNDFEYIGPFLTLLLLRNKCFVVLFTIIKLLFDIFKS